MDPTHFAHSSAGQPRQHPQGYWYFLPAPLPPALTWSPTLVHHLGEAERNLSRLAGLSNALPMAALLRYAFIRREAVISSRIEGTRATLQDVYAYEAQQLALFEPSPDVQEVHNYVRSLEYGLARLPSFPLSLRLIREVHQRLMDQVRGHLLTPGEFRRSQNWIGPAGSTLANAPYVPPPVDEMQLALNQFEVFLHTPAELSPLVKAGLIHYQFEAIHPFLDGNGRVGRLLILLVLNVWGLLPEPLLNLSAYFDRHRQEYYRHLLAVSQQGAWEAWLQFFLQGISQEAQAAEQRISRLLSLREVLIGQIQQERAADRLVQAVDVLFELPILSIPQLAEALEVPYMSASRYVARLVQLGILEEITGQARNRVYRARQVLQEFDQ